MCIKISSRREGLEKLSEGERTRFIKTGCINEFSFI